MVNGCGAAVSVAIDDDDDDGGGGADCSRFISK